MSTVVSSGELLLRSIVFTRPVRLVDPSSWVPHIPFAFWLIDALRPRTVVELGTHTGVSYSAFAQAVQMLGLDAATYAVDTWKGDHQAGFYREDVFTEWSSFHDHHFNAFSRLVRSTFDEALSKFPDGSIDLLHLDGVHTYEAVRQDFESWFPKLSNRAVVLMHDTNVHEADFGVGRFWLEVSARHPSFAFLHGHGLGVVGVGHSLPDDVRALVEYVNGQGRNAFKVREFFATLGEGLLRQLRESTRAPERQQTLARLEEQNALVARLTTEAAQACARRAEDDAALQQVHGLTADLARQLSAASLALDRAHMDAPIQAEQLSAMTTELASLREGSRAAERKADAERDRAEALQNEIMALIGRLDRAQMDAEAARGRTKALTRDLAVLREDSRAAQRKADAERDRAKALQDEVVALRRRFDRAHKRRTVLRRKVLSLREANSRLTRHHAVQAAHQRKLARSLKQVYGSRSWRWTAPFRRAVGVLGIKSLARSLRRWAHTARTLLSPSQLRDVRAIARCGLFDEAFYLRTYPDVGRAAITPLVHYAVTGAREGRRPHPLFDTKYYLAQNPDLRESGANPLLHFVRRGAIGVCDPHPLFSIRYYLAAASDIQTAGLDPLSHYLRLGSQKGLTPHPLFEPGFYCNQYTDVRAAGVNPLVHFVEHGASEGRSPHPLFDTRFYLKECGGESRVGVNPLRHYLEAGLSESHDPHPLFENSFYLGQVPELENLGITPLQHFVESGVREGRWPNPFFDPTWYLQTYSEVATSGQNALAYYATRGWEQGHDPSLKFSTSYYLQKNKDVARARVCPLAHYLRDGRREARLPRKATALDDSLVPDVPPQVTLRVHCTRTTSGRFSLDAAPVTSGPPRTIICLSHVIPLPPRAGNEYRIHRMLARLRRSGYRIVLLVAPLSPSTIGDAQWEALGAAYGNVVHCERDGHVRHQLDECPDVLSQLDGHQTGDYAGLLSEVQPMTLAARDALHIDRSFSHDVLIATFLQLQKSLAPCAVLAEYVWMTRAFPLLDPGVLTVIDTIDVFSTYHEKVGAFGVHGWNVPPEEEARRLVRAQVIVAIQSEEARILRTLAPEREVLTAGVDFEVLERSDWPADPVVFCVGSDNPRNVMGVRDFLRFAWPEIKSAIPDARLVVAGSVGAAVPDYVQGVDVLGHVQDLDPLYLRARVVVNPAIAGTGLKIKTVEALSRLRPIVCWPNGLEGVPPDLAKLVPPAQDWFDFAERVITWLRVETSAFDTSTAASLRDLLSAEQVYSELEARLGRFFDAHRSQKA